MVLAFRGPDGGRLETERATIDRVRGVVQKYYQPIFDDAADRLRSYNVGALQISVPRVGTVGLVDIVQAVGDSWCYLAAAYQCWSGRSAAVVATWVGVVHKTLVDMRDIFIPNLAGAQVTLAEKVASFDQLITNVKAFDSTMAEISRASNEWRAGDLFIPYTNVVHCAYEERQKVRDAQNAAQQGAAHQTR